MAYIGQNFWHKSDDFLVCYIEVRNNRNQWILYYCYKGTKVTTHYKCCLVITGFTCAGNAVCKNMIKYD